MYNTSSEQSELSCQLDAILFSHRFSVNILLSERVNEKINEFHMSLKKFETLARKY